MATLTGFTRPSDPIQVDDLASSLSSLLGVPLTIDVTPTDIIVTGSVTESNRAMLQAGMNSYYYNYVQIGAPLSDNPNMSAKRHNTAVSEYASFMSTSSIASLSNKSQSGTTVTTGTWPILRKSSTNGSGVATIYLTDDGTATGNAVFSTVYEDGIIVMPVGGNSNYQVVSVVLSANKKSIAVTVNQLGSVILGLVNVTSAASGVEVRGAIWGK